MLVKRSAFALAFLFVLYITEWIIYGFMVWKLDESTADSIQNFFPLKSMYKLIDQPFQRIAISKMPNSANMMYDFAVHWYEIAIVLGWTAIFIFFSYKLLKKRDL